MKDIELIQESFQELNIEVCSSYEEQYYKDIFYENILRNNNGLILNKKFYAKADKYFENNMAIK
ncbi:hypothetical protein [Campylobacter sp. RM12651]|uniref:hypothetical protein n=1 Tax=Campylobacter sp. RM12651 TaxID=1660079 RepID=UPI001EFBA109|nr:hypothetical protein [Campylobacter sp. RM12651]ULO04551.1 hypothetical protein AVBRAN_a0069 [Campylobacter sp. RM12651]